MERGKPWIDWSGGYYALWTSPDYTRLACRLIMRCNGSRGQHAPMSRLRLTTAIPVYNGKMTSMAL